MGEPVDALDLSLSIGGLTATILALPSGGSSETVKVGAGLIKTARGMRLLSGGMETLLLTAARRAVKWDELLHWDAATDPARLLRPEAIRPLQRIASDLGRIATKTDTTTTLHLLRYIDDPQDARRIADAVDTMGPKVVGRLTFLGKGRFLWLGLRYSRLAVEFMASLVGLLTRLALLIGSILQRILWRAMRGGLRRVARG